MARKLTPTEVFKAMMGDDTRIEFLKCDDKGCIYVEYYDKLDESLIGRPCPSCGSNLLTKEDWEKWKTMN